MTGVSVILATKDEQRNLPRCLAALKDFEDVTILESGNTDDVHSLLSRMGCTSVRVVAYKWNGRYPKKRQWALENLGLKYKRVLFVDADEVVSPALSNEIRNLDWRHAGYFIRSPNVIQGKRLRFGVPNHKLCLFDSGRMMFPVVDDLDIPGMGEIEGHYQPVFKPSQEGSLGTLNAPLYHYAYEDAAAWREKHARYALWEREMRHRNAYPPEVSAGRGVLKALFGTLPRKDIFYFLYAYVLKAGFLDGREGLKVALSKAYYYHDIGKD